MRTRVFAAAAALALSACGLVTSAAAPAGAATHPVLFGLTDHWEKYVDADNTQLHFHAGVVNLFAQWTTASSGRTNNVNYMTWIRSNGAAPMVTLQPPSSASLSSINAGHYDSYLRAWARAFAHWGHPMFLRLFPEMNQQSHTYAPGYGSNTTSQFRTAWRHVFNIFHNNGATNARFVWCPYRVYNSATPLKSVWPGGSYVNWVGFDAYNYDDSSHPFAWPYALFSPTVKGIRAITTTKPLLIAEVGAAPDSAKPTWVAKSVTAAQSVGAKIMLWFDESAEHNWRLDSSPSGTLNSARTAIHSSNVTYAGHRDVNGVLWNISRIDTLVKSGK